MPVSMTSTHLWALLAGIQLVILPFYWRIPVPVVITVVIFSVWVAMIALQRTRTPTRFVRIMLLVLAIAVMGVSYGTLLGKDAGTGFLILLAFLKLFEVNDKRDIYMVVFLNYFLIASNFFHTQSPWIAVYVFVVVLYLTSLLILFSDRQGSITLHQRLRIASRILLQATPLMLVLFVLFPRIPGPLWGLPKDATAASTGLSEDMSPGSLSNLSQSDEVAFRVRFGTDAPPHESMYWRGPVFSYYDGWTWTSGITSAKAVASLQISGDEANLVKYTVTLEPHQRNWLFALEHPVGLQTSGYRLNRELQLLNKNKIHSVFQYTLVSDTAASSRELLYVERYRNLRLPDGFNPRTLELARSWREAAGEDDRMVIDNALAHFREEPFVYTLSPPLLGNDAMDDFLFETRRGFCEHYSSAFVILMRAAGIPARVVTGYQGAEKNPLDDYIIVRQSNAHAWAEVWLDSDGWVRIDPTSAVSPGRIELGIQNAVAERELLPTILVSDNALLRQIQYQWDSFNNTWNEWVVGFDQKRQQQLFRDLGMGTADWKELITWMAVAMLLVGGLIFWWVLKQGSGIKLDRVRRAYERFCSKLARTGIERVMSDGPQEYYARVRDRLSPACASAADRVIDRYVKIRYGGDGSSENINEFLRLVRQFRVRI